MITTANDHSRPENTFKPTRLAYFGYLAIPFAITAIFTTAAIRGPDNPTLPFIAMAFFGIMAVVVFWLASFRLRITRNAIFVRRLRLSFPIIQDDRVNFDDITYGIVSNSLSNKLEFERISRRSVSLSFLFVTHKSKGGVEKYLLVNVSPLDVGALKAALRGVHGFEIGNFSGLPRL